MRGFSAACPAAPPRRAPRDGSGSKDSSRFHLSESELDLKLAGLGADDHLLEGLSPVAPLCLSRADSERASEGEMDPTLKSLITTPSTSQRASRLSMGASMAAAPFGAHQNFRVRVLRDLVTPQLGQVGNNTSADQAAAEELTHDRAVAGPTTRGGERINGG
jgi:hypothetical protein